MWLESCQLLTACPACFLMNKPHNIHDNHFRESMGRKEVAQDFLDNYLPPAVLSHLDLRTLREVLINSVIAKPLG
ncbi:hypothetical protein MASR1M90_04300 [Desulfovibrionales bacterium]